MTPAPPINQLILFQITMYLRFFLCPCAGLEQSFEHKSDERFSGQEAREGKVWWSLFFLIWNILGICLFNITIKHVFNHKIMFSGGSINWPYHSKFKSMFSTKISSESLFSLHGWRIENKGSMTKLFSGLHESEFYIRCTTHGNIDQYRKYI